MHIDPLMPLLTATALAILLLGLFLRKFKIPHLISYLLVGVLIGPYGLNILGDRFDFTQLGSIGVLLLLFFLGMEISLPRLIANWKIAIVGTLLQIFISVGCAVVIGLFFDWSFADGVFIGFVITLSSTAVVIKILQERNEISSDVGRDVIGILLIQDLALVPMLITIDLISDKSMNIINIIIQILGGIIFLAFLAYIWYKKEIKLPFGELLKKDYEMQIFSAFVLCFGLAFITSLLNLSAALGAFLAGLILSSAKETEWVHKRLEPFYIVFVALFFVSIGLIVDLQFLSDNLFLIIILVVLVIFLNTIINSLIMRALGINWKRSIYAGALLSQIGEFSYILAAVGLSANMIAEFDYQITVGVISITLFVSPFWIIMIKNIADKKFK